MEQGEGTRTSLSSRPTGSAGQRGIEIEIEIEGMIAQLSDIIHDLGDHRPEASDGIGWVSFDAAICSLHRAVIALEEFSADRSELTDRPIPA